MAREKLAKTLREKGWTEEEVTKAMNTMNAETSDLKHLDKREEITSHFNTFIYWTGLLIAIIGNILLSVILVPLMLYLSPGILYFVIIVVGLTFGTLFNALINSIEEVDYKHHIVAGLFIPTIALLNVFIMVRLSNQLNQALQLTEITYQPMLIGAIYVASFMVPYIFTKIKENVVLKSSVEEK